MFERFTDRSRRVLVLAQEEARLLSQNFIGTEHILLGLIHEGDGVGAQALGLLGITLDAVRQMVEPTTRRGGASVGSPPFTPNAKKALELALREALRLDHNYIGTEHLLLGLLDNPDATAVRILSELGADKGDIRAAVIDRLANSPEAVQGPSQRSRQGSGGPRPSAPACPNGACQPF